MSHVQVHFCYSLITLFSLFLHLHIIYFMHLLSSNHKCTQPCYFPVLYKPASQKVKMDMKNSLMRSSILCATPDCFSCGVMESSAILLCNRVA
jgi:hypothetical protein